MTLQRYKKRANNRSFFKNIFIQCLSRRTETRAAPLLGEDELPLVFVPLTFVRRVLFWRAFLAFAFCAAFTL
jgi:hypothetical protein